MPVLLPLVPVVLVAALMVSACSANTPVGAEAASTGMSGEEIWNETEAKVFNPMVHRIEVKLNQEVWNQLHADEHQGCKARNECKTAHVRSFRYDDVTLENVAMKVRGNTSRTVPRLQFNLAFDKHKNVFTKKPGEGWREVAYDDATKAQIKERTLHGLKELSLRRSKNDSSSGDDRGWGGSGMLAREFVGTWAASQVERVAKTTVRGAPVYRTAYAHVTFRLCSGDQDENCDNRIERIYTVAENLDKTFFATRFDDRKPTYFSMSMGCAMKGDSKFDDAVDGQPCLEAEAVEGEKYDADKPELVEKARSRFDGPQGLKARIDAATSLEELGRILDLDSFMNYAAVASTLGHWDSAFGNFNNDTLYFHAASGKWKIITWDLDNTFDYDLPGHPRRSWNYADLGQTRVLFDKLFSLNDGGAKQRLRDYLGIIYDREGNGPLNDKIIEVRDQYVAKINDMLPPGERQDIGAFQQEMFDYKKDRYFALLEQLR